jgi:SAM-dependent methyltransferase
MSSVPTTPDYLSQGLDLPGGGELTEALEGFQPAGSLLELACGPGVWTSALLRHATDVTAVDASTQMLTIAAARTTSSRVRFIQADLFAWRPDRRYDAVFMGFWISHVPAERFASFWSLVADCLKPEGRVFFCDDAYRTEDELIDGPGSSTIRRHVPDGTAYRLVKSPTGRPASKASSANSAGTSRSTRQQALSTGAQGNAPPTGDPGTRVNQLM